MMVRCRALVLFLVCTFIAATTHAADGPTSNRSAPAFPGAPAFAHRGFYLHAGWFFKYPFAVRTWQPADFKDMFELLRCFGFDRVMLWPMLESIPAPLSDVDAEALRQYRPIIDEAHDSGLECWLTQCPNLTPRPEIAAKPWMQRNPYPFFKTVRMDVPAEADAYLAHRTKMLSILNNADAYVTIDGDPGGYAGAKPDDWLRIFKSDRSAIDRFGVAPKRQMLVPWVWCGWGTRAVWAEPTEAFAKASMQALRDQMPDPWELMAGRSNHESWANGRINVVLADQMKMMDHASIICYEAIEYEPTQPAALLQLDDIRRILRQESSYASRCRGVMGNAQQPVMVLPNIYLFARGAWDPKYLDQPDSKVLADLAAMLGGPAELLTPAWSCLRLQLGELPADLPRKLRSAHLTGEAGRHIPGGADRYLDILAHQVESRRGLLSAIAQKPNTPAETAAALADGVRALVGWWEVHHFVIDGNGDEPFHWLYVRDDQVAPLRAWCRTNVQAPDVVAGLAVKRLVADGTLTQPVATSRVAELLAR